MMTAKRIEQVEAEPEVGIASASVVIERITWSTTPLARSAEVTASGTQIRSDRTTA